MTLPYQLRSRMRGTQFIVSLLGDDAREAYNKSRHKDPLSIQRHGDHRTQRSGYMRANMSSQPTTYISLPNSYLTLRSHHSVFADDFFPSRYQKITAHISVSKSYPDGHGARFVLRNRNADKPPTPRPGSQTKGVLNAHAVISNCHAPLFARPM